MTPSRLKSAALAIAALMIVGCSSTSPGTSSDAAPVDVTLRKGMSISEVDAIYGAPNSIEEKVIGQKTKAPWEGIIWKYKLDEDPTYSYAIRQLTNTLVFTKSTNPPTLVYWEIEQIPKPKGTKH